LLTLSVGGLSSGAQHHFFRTVQHQTAIPDKSAQFDGPKDSDGAPERKYAMGDKGKKDKDKARKQKIVKQERFAKKAQAQATCGCGVSFSI